MTSWHRYFYPRPPRGGRHAAPKTVLCQKDFYPRPPRGGRPLATQLASCCCEFLSTPSARRATIEPMRFLCQYRDFYPRPPRGGRLSWYVMTSSTCYFYPRPPRGGRQLILFVFRAVTLFLSTPSARRATGTGGRDKQTSKYFYPRPPRGGRHPAQRSKDKVLTDISIHALREEGDPLFRNLPPTRQDFYPRPPRGGRRWQP